MSAQICIMLTPRHVFICTYLEEIPEVHEVAGEHELLGFGDEAVGHEAEVLHQFGGPVHRHVHVELGPAQQAQQ